MEPLDRIQQFLEYVVQNLALSPGKARVVRSVKGDTHLFHVEADREDVPRLVGRSGNTVVAMQSLAMAVAAPYGVKVEVEIVG